MSAGDTSAYTILVPIDRPTALEDEVFIALPGQDMFLNYVPNVHVLPGRVDVDRLKTALARTGARYPPIAGRLVREGDSWKINLTNDSIPIVVDVKDSAAAQAHSPEAFPFKNGWVIQDRDDIRSLVTSTHSKWMLRGEGVEPLVVFKVTQWATKSAIGVAWHHTLGDAKCLFDFMITLSTLYEDPEAPASKLPPSPSFYRHFFPSPFSSVPGLSDSFIPRMPHLVNDYPLQGVMDAYRRGEEDTDLVHVRIPHASMQRMLDAIPQLDNGARFELSPHDALMTYLVTVLNRSLEKPVRRIINVVNYRAPMKMLGSEGLAPFAHPAAFCNCIMAMVSDPIPEDQRLSAPHVAQVIRSAIVQTRDRTFMERWMTLGSFFMNKMANADRYIVYLPNEGDTTINSNYRLDWNEAHFGFPGQARFHTSWSTTNFFRIYVANPSDTGMKIEAGSGDADITFKIRKASKAKYISIVQKVHPDVIIES